MISVVCALIINAMILPHYSSVLACEKVSAMFYMYLNSSMSGQSLSFSLDELDMSCETT